VARGSSRPTKRPEIRLQSDLSAAVSASRLELSLDPGVQIPLVRRHRASRTMMAPTKLRLRQIVTPILLTHLAYPTIEGVARRLVREAQPAVLRRPGVLNPSTLATHRPQPQVGDNTRQDPPRGPSTGVFSRGPHTSSGWS